MKKNKDTDEKKSKPENDNLDKTQQLNSNAPKESDDLDSRLDEIKKLASDFYVEDESQTADDNANQIESEPGADDSSADDYIDRLNDIQIDKDYVSVISSGDDIDTRLDRINQDQENIDANKKVEITPKKPAEISALPAPAVDPQKKPPIIIKKKTISIDNIEKEAEAIMEQNRTNEDFVDRIQSALNEDEQVLPPVSKSESENVFKTFDKDLDDSEIIQELEQEIVNAEKAVNPFIEEINSEDSDDFLTNLDKITTPEEVLTKNNDKNRLENMPESELSLSTSSWEDLLDSMDDEDLVEDQKVFNFDEEQPFETFLQESGPFESEEKSTIPMLGDGQEIEYDGQVDGGDFAFISSLENDGLNELEDESVESLRKSFNEEFDQSAFDEEIEKKSKKKWLPTKLDTFSNWIKSLSLAEKILIILSFLVSLAVIISIFLVITQWSMNSRQIASPPPAIQATDQDIIYPTGLQLPGGWFFFLQRGEIQDNKWEPQNAEWLANTKLRRVVAIPWSNQSEEVVKSLTFEDEISIYMNNNDIIVYQVEDVVQISRDNVRILSDTEPSLVVILFREDNEDRWSIIAKPKPMK